MTVPVSAIEDSHCYGWVILRRRGAPLTRRWLSQETARELGAVYGAFKKSEFVVFDRHGARHEHWFPVERMAAGDLENHIVVDPRDYREMVEGDL